MSTLVVTFAFPSDAQSFVSTRGTRVTMAWDGANGNPVGSLSSTRSVKGASSAASKWARTLTYEAMGVPVNSTITCITAGSLQSKCTAFTSAGSGNLSGTATLVDGATTATLSAARSITATDSSFVTTTGTDLTGLSKPSSNS